MSTITPTLDRRTMGLLPSVLIVACRAARRFARTPQLRLLPGDRSLHVRAYTPTAVEH